MLGDDSARITLDGKAIAVTHGDNDAAVRRLLDEQSLDYLFTGHTHHPHDRREGRTRWIDTPAPCTAPAPGPWPRWIWPPTSSDR